MTDLVVRSTTPANTEWLLIQHQAQELAKSDIIPRAYFRKPANVIVAALTGRHYGWDVLTAMRNGHVIDGTWGMKPEAMLGLVRQAGHSVDADMRADGTTLVGERADNGDKMTVSFTLDDAVRANLVRIKDGKPFARSKQGNPLPWEQYPQVMCYWRAVALLCRLLFSDLTAGVHSAEELGAFTTVDGDVIDAVEVATVEEAEPQPLSDEALAAFERACGEEGLTRAEVLAEAFGDKQPETLTDALLPAMRDAFRRLVEAKAQPQPEAEIVDAEVVEEDAPEQPTLDEAAAEVRPATRSQVARIKAAYNPLDRDAQFAATAEVIGRTVESHNKLTYDEAEVLLEALKDL